MEDFPVSNGDAEGTEPTEGLGTPLVAFGDGDNTLEVQFRQALQNGDRAECLRLIKVIECLKSQESAAQAQLSYRIEQLTIEENLANDKAKRERGSAAAIALARHKPQKGSRLFLVGSRFLAEDLPCLSARFHAGDFTEEQILAITSPLQDVTAQQRRDFDAHFEAHPNMLEGLGRQRITDVVRKFTDKVQSESRTEKITEANEDRYIRFSKGKDCVMINGRLPLEEGLALQRHLMAQVKVAKNSGDPRTETQLMCDLMVRHPITGDERPLPLKIDIKLIMTDRALFLGENEPAYLPGYGIIPAQYARQMITNAENTAKGPFAPRIRTEMYDRIASFPEIQRIFTAPGNEDLIAMDARSRLFPHKLRDFIEYRDLHCRTPYCDNKPTEIDHIAQWWLGGKTTATNGAYRCKHCNLAKEQAPWSEFLDQIFPQTMNIQPEPGVIYGSLPPTATGLGREDNPEINPLDSWLVPLEPPQEPDPPDPEDPGESEALPDDDE